MAPSDTASVVECPLIGLMNTGSSACSGSQAPHSRNWAATDVTCARLKL